MHTRALMATHPYARDRTNDALVRCIEECFGCAQACTACADACLGEEMIKDVAQCIRLDLDCADLCAATGAIASRLTGSNETVLRLVLEACADACRVCAEECERHAARHEHCRICADACRRCESACREAAATVKSRLQ